MEPSNSSPGCVPKREEDVGLLIGLPLVGQSRAGMGRAQFYTVPLSLTKYSLVFPSGSAWKQGRMGLNVSWVGHRSWRRVPR